MTQSTPTSELESDLDEIRTVDEAYAAASDHAADGPAPIETVERHVESDLVPGQSVAVAPGVRQSKPGTVAVRAALLPAARMGQGVGEVHALIDAASIEAVDRIIQASLDAAAAENARLGPANSSLGQVPAMFAFERDATSAFRFLRREVAEGGRAVRFVFARAGADVGNSVVRRREAERRMADEPRRRAAEQAEQQRHIESQRRQKTAAAIEHLKALPEGERAETLATLNDAIGEEG